MRAGRDAARVFHHVGDQLAEDRVVEIVDRLVGLPDLHRLVGVVLADRVDHQAQVLLHQPRHGGEAGQAERQRELAEHDAALGDVLGVVADPLQRGGDLQRRRRSAAGRWPSAGAAPASGSPAARPGAPARRPPESCCTARVAISGSLLAIACVASASWLSTMPPISLIRSRSRCSSCEKHFTMCGASGRRRVLALTAHPNRPVMYSWVFFCFGAVNRSPAGATSTISPR